MNERQDQLQQKLIELADRIQSDADELSDHDLGSLSQQGLDELNRIKEAVGFLDRIRHNLDQNDPESSLTTEPADNHDTVGEASPDSSVDRDFKTIPDQLGRFVIKEILGEGGFARVYRARDPQLDRDVALKIPKPHALMSAEARIRFEREAKAAAVLSHPAIVPVFESGSVGPISYIASEYCPGPTLAEWFAKSNRKVDPRIAAEIVGRLAEATQHAHQRGVVHRDLKPANILLQAGAETIGQGIRITDFGLARQIESGDETLTVEGAIVGTPAYMSPEQAAGDKEIMAATDIYSLGTILYELLSGQLPFRRGAHLATLRAVETEEPTALRKLDSTIPRDLEAICNKCMQKRASDRYDSAFGLAEDLAAWLDGRPVAARPIPRMQRLIRWTQRNPALAAALSFAFLSLVIGLAATTYQSIRATRNSVRASNETQRAERHLDHINTTVDRLLDQIGSEYEPTRIPTSQRAFLTDVLQLQQELIQQEQGNPEINLNTLRAFVRAANIHRVLAQNDQALVLIGEARNLIANQNVYGTDDDNNRELVGQIVNLYQNEVAILTTTSRGADALVAVERMEQIFNEHESLFTDSQRLYYRCRCAGSKTLALLASNKLEQAADSVERAIELGNALTVNDVKNRDLRNAIAGSALNYATILSRQGQFEESSRMSEHAISLFSNASETEKGGPLDHASRRGLAVARYNWSNTLKRLGLQEDQETQLGMAIQLLQALAAESPGNPRYLETLAKAFQGTAQVEYSRNDFDKALEINQKAIDLEDRGIKQTLVGNAALVKAMRFQAGTLIKMKRLDEAENYINDAIATGELAFSNEEEFMEGKAMLVDAWRTLLHVHDQRNDSTAYLSTMPGYQETLENWLNLNPGPRLVAITMEANSKAVRKEVTHLANLGRWEEAVVASERIAECKHYRGKNAGKNRYDSAAYALARVLWMWTESGEQRGPEFESAQELALDWLEIAIRDLGYGPKESLQTTDVWRELLDHPRFPELLDAMDD